MKTIFNIRFNACFNLLLALLLLTIFDSCKKNEFLDAKPNSNIVVPSTLTDFQALLDNTQVFGMTPFMGEISADNYYLTYTSWQGLTAISDRNLYIWAPDIYQGTGGIVDWNTSYKQVFYCNVVLDNISNVTTTTGNQTQWNNIKGSALFLRAYAFYNLASEFAQTYDNTTSSTDLGISLKLSSDVNNIPQRTTVAQTYQQILGDLKTALPLLSSTVNLSQANRPSKPAAFALLARIALSMRDYTNAKIYADSTLNLYSTLVDYNTLAAGTNFPFTLLKPSTAEAMYQSMMLNNDLTVTTVGPAIADTLLYSSFNSNDLRKAIYFRLKSGIESPGWGYGGSYYGFTGLATDEVYLIRAECEARAGNTTAAMADLNAVLVKRFKTGTFTSLTAVSSSDALNQVLTERRKELIWRGLRWTDLKRLNKDGANITLTRILNGTTYTLAPNSPLYVLPIPPDEIALSGIQQNQR